MDLIHSWVKLYYMIDFAPSILIIDYQQNLHFVLEGLILTYHDHYEIWVKGIRGKL